MATGTLNALPEKELCCVFDALIGVGHLLIPGYRRMTGDASRSGHDLSHELIVRLVVGGCYRESIDERLRS